jgi:uncharacterized membrane protein YgaE (UPF0421/DUF939 family)
MINKMQSEIEKLGKRVDNILQEQLALKSYIWDTENIDEESLNTEFADLVRNAVQYSLIRQKFIRIEEQYLPKIDNLLNMIDKLQIRVAKLEELPQVETLFHRQLKTMPDFIEEWRNTFALLENRVSGLEGLV